MTILATVISTDEQLVLNTVEYGLIVFDKEHYFVEDEQLAIEVCEKQTHNYTYAAAYKDITSEPLFIWVLLPNEST